MKFKNTSNVRQPVPWMVAFWPWEVREVEKKDEDLLNNHIFIKPVLPKPEVKKVLDKKSKNGTK